MLLDLVKRMPLPVKPQPPEVRYIKDEKPIPKPIATPKRPSRIWCFFGVHKYSIKDESTWKRTDRGTVIAKGPMYILRCDVCGKMKAECL